jgi:putative flippase GtrA
VKLARLFAKYSLSGVVNTVIGYAIIFACMHFGLTPTVSNVIGYAVGCLLSFVQSRYWVFRSSGTLTRDATRFLPMFLLAYAVNFAVLQTSLALGVNAYLAQIAAGVAFVFAGFLLNHLFVFRERKP